MTNKFFPDGTAKHYMKHKIYCRFCSHYEIEISHWDGTSFIITVKCSRCGKSTEYKYDNPFDRNGWTILDD